MSVKRAKQSQRGSPSHWAANFSHNDHKDPRHRSHPNRSPGQTGHFASAIWKFLSAFALIAAIAAAQPGVGSSKLVTLS